MKKVLSALCALAMLTAMCGCSSSEESSESKESSSKVVTTTIETTTEIATETTTKKQREKPSIQDYYATKKFSGTYNGEYFSIDIPTGSNLITNDFGGADYIEFEIPSANDVTPDSAKFKLYTLDMSFMNYADNNDYITQNFKISEDETYKNPYGIEMIRRYKSGSETFLFYNNGNAIKLEFDSAFSLSKIQSLLETIQFIDTVAQTEAVEEETIESVTEPTTKKPTEPPQNSASLGEQNALDSALSYIKRSDFSYEGLIEQLEYEKYTHDEAVYAADNCGANWNEEAVESGKSYISYSDFSYLGLIEQLEYEKFTHEQAVYGADNCGADWYQEAAECAESYMKSLSMSREELIEQLIYEKFTPEQAEYGASAVGY